MFGGSEATTDTMVDSKHSQQRWYCGNSVNVVDKRLLGIKPPNVVTRVPRSIEHHVKFWKGKYKLHLCSKTIMIN